MERHGDKLRSAVPQFGAWDKKGDGNSGYSMVFSQARAKRKQSINHGNEPDGLVVKPNEQDDSKFDLKLDNELDFKPKNDLTDKEDSRQPMYEVKFGGGGDFDLKPTNESTMANEKEPKLMANPNPNSTQPKLDNEVNVSSQPTYYGPQHGYQNQQYYYARQHQYQHGGYQPHHHQGPGVVGMGYGWRPIPQYAGQYGVPQQGPVNHYGHQHHHYRHHRHHQQGDDASKKKFLTYIRCCVRPQY